MNLSSEIDEINNGLATKGIKMRLENRGKYLNLRGPLPSKENKDQIKIQRISLGLPANIEGLNECEKLLQLLLLQLQHNQFNWQNWEKHISRKGNKNNNSIAECIEKFELLFFKNITHSKSFSSKKTTWNSAYKPYLNRLQKITENKSQSLNAQLLCEVLKSYKENSRSRQQCSSTLGVFARYLNIELPEDWKRLAAGYGIKKYNFRELPDDNKIKEFLYLIPNKNWRIVYGVMATYGLRNHEVFFSDYSSLSKNGDHILRVLPNTKTGEHQVWPFHPEWVGLFELDKITATSGLLPDIKTDLKETTLQHIGRRVSEQFRRYKISFTPYDLRHSWAVRTILIGLPNTVAAKMM